MSAFSWYIGFIVMSWLFGYGLGRIFLDIRRFVEKCK